MIKEIFRLQNTWRFGETFPFSLRKRTILELILNNLNNKKILGLIGSRQVGKSSLLYLTISHLIETNINVNDIYYFNLDDLKLHELFKNVPDFINFIQAGGAKKYLLIDEIQRLENPGLFLKEIYDLGLNIKILYSGSSQLEIKSKLKEHLVGRARQFDIHRLSFSEYLDFNRPITRNQALTEMLIYGSYPEVSLEQHSIEKKLAIKDIYQAYVEKDLVDFLKIDNIDAFNNLLVLLANQIGSLLNVHSLSKTLKISRKEVEKYLSVLEKTFIIKRVYPFHKNYKKEITKTPKIYFMDLGLRNYVINNFNDLPLRKDQGDLFENFCLLEFVMSDPYSLNRINFWRTTNQTEVDFFITKGDSIKAIETKWKKTAIPKSFRTIQKYYPEIETKVVSKNVFLESDTPIVENGTI
jgi:predicted AAA+ superfamily ATPase